MRTKYMIFSNNIFSIFFICVNIIHYSNYFFNGYETRLHTNVIAIVEKEINNGENNNIDTQLDKKYFMQTQSM